MLKLSLKALACLACIAAAGSAVNATVPRPLIAEHPQRAVHPVTFEAIDNSGLFWDKQVPACDNGAVLERIRNRFRYQVHSVPYLPNVDIVTFRRIQQRRFVPSDSVSGFARRYCRATADLSDGKARAVYYMIVDEMGFVSIGDGVEFCVPGFDRWRVYSGHCRLLY